MDRKQLFLMGASSACAIILVSPTAGNAETQTTPPPQTPQSGEARHNNEIVVTGSRIRRPDLVSEQPLQVVSGQELNERGYTTIADALGILPISGALESTRGQQGDNVGRSYVNLFQLGSNRTLTLVNGRRFVASNPASSASIIGGNQVDLNNIPSGLIDRVEIVQATGSAIYGSDAIAGVVNIILKDNFQGLELDGQYGNTTRADLRSFRVRATGGMNFGGGRGNITFSLEHSESGGLAQSERPAGAGYSFIPNSADTGPNDGIPSTVFACCRRVPEVTLGGLPYRSTSSSVSNIVTIPNPSNPANRIPVQFSSDGTLVPYDPGRLCGSACTIGGDGWNTNPFATLITPVRRTVLYATGHYDLTNDVRIFFEASNSWVTAQEVARQGAGGNSILFNGINGPVTIQVDNPFLTAQARSIIQAAGLTQFFLSRFNADVLPEYSSRRLDVETSRGVVGLEGDFQLGNHDFYWSAFANRGVSEGHSQYTDIDTQRFIYAADAVRAPNGNIVCRVTLQNPGSLDQNISQCQPINLLGFGAPSAAARNYVSVLLEQFHRLTQTNVEASLGGELLHLPAGDLSFSIGADYRKETSSFTANQARLIGQGRSGRILPISGDIDTREAFGELLIPLVGGGFTLPLIRSLDIRGAARIVDHSRAGVDWAWNVGVRWKPIDDITIRASRSRTFRAPSVFELFLPRQIISQSLNDPCDFRFINTGNNPTARLRNCQALFVSAGFPANQNFVSIRTGAGTFPVTFGGNPNLENEVADSWTAGAVLEPRFIPGLSLTVDYVKINISGAIVNFNSTSIANTCFDAENPDPNICNLITRNAQLQVQDVTTGFVNAGFTRFAGINFSVSYVLPLQRIAASLPGRLSLTASVLNTRRLETSVSGLGYDLNVSAGEYAAPHWKGQFTATYTNGPLTLSWFTRYVGPAVADVLFTRENRDILGTGDSFRHDISVQYRLEPNLRLRAGLYNIFDRLPSLGASSLDLFGTNGSNVDVVGRSFFVGATLRY